MKLSSLLEFSSVILTLGLSGAWAQAPGNSTESTDLQSSSSSSLTSSIATPRTASIASDTSSVSLFDSDSSTSSLETSMSTSSRVPSTTSTSQLTTSSYSSFLPTSAATIASVSRSEAPSSSVLLSASMTSDAATTTSAAPSSYKTTSRSSTMIDVMYLTTFVMDGSSSMQTTISRTVVVIGTATGSSIAEVTAALNAASQNSNSALSSQNKKIIIGVIAGVAGVVILSALGTLLYRVFRKRPPGHEYREAKEGFVFTTTHESNSSTYLGSVSKFRPKVGEISQNF